MNRSSEISWRRIDSFSGNSTCPELVYHRPCPICEGISYSVVLEFSDFQFYSDSNEHPKRTSVRQVQCRNCFAIYMNPCYSSYGFSVLFAEAGQSYGSTAVRPVEQIAWLEERGLLQPETRLLDVGCYDGRFLASLPPNIEKIGVDVDRAAIERARSLHANAAMKLILGDLESFGYEEAAPNVVTMFHVLEHLPRPVAVLRRLRSVANKDTRLVVEVPILENGQRTNDINGFLSIQHMTHFSRASLRNALHVSRWEVVHWQEMQAYNGCRVLAKPTEDERSPKTEVQDVAELYTYLAAWYRILTNVEGRIRAIPAVGKMVLWGAGAHTEFLYWNSSFFISDPKRLYALVDSDRLKHGRSWRGIAVSMPEALKGLDWSDTVLVVSSYGGQEEIARAAAQLGVPRERIVRLYDRVSVY